MRRAHDLPILIGEPFVITANRDADSQSSWDSLIRSQLGNNRPGAVQAAMGDEITSDPPSGIDPNQDTLRFNIDT